MEALMPLSFVSFLLPLVLLFFIDNIMKKNIRQELKISNINLDYTSLIIILLLD
jgi:hypothetical protein